MGTAALGQRLRHGRASRHVGMRNAVRALSWLAAATICLGACVATWLAASGANPTRESAFETAAAEAVWIAVLVGLPLLFAGALLSVRGALPLIPVATCAYFFALLWTFDDYYWPDRQRYVESAPRPILGLAVVAALAAAALAWRRRLLGAVANVGLVLLLFFALLASGSH
jgi:hypothetical protein